MASSVLPQPAGPQTSVGRPRGRPPPVTSSSPLMPVGAFGRPWLGLLVGVEPVRLDAHRRHAHASWFAGGVEPVTGRPRFVALSTKRLSVLPETWRMTPRQPHSTGPDEIYRAFG